MKIGSLRKRGKKMLNKNKAPHHIDQLVPVHKTCKVCDKEITLENRVRNYGGVGYQKMCKPCRNLKSKKYGKKKADILKANPLW